MSHCVISAYGTFPCLVLHCRWQHRWGGYLLSVIRIDFYRLHFGNVKWIWILLWLVHIYLGWWICSSWVIVWLTFSSFSAIRWRNILLFSFIGANGNIFGDLLGKIGMLDYLLDRWPLIRSHSNDRFHQGDFFGS